MVTDTRSKDAKNQHFLPQFLLQGFAWEVRGGEVFVCAFRKEKKYRPNIRNIGAENYFYGRVAETGVEAALHTIENRAGAVLNTIRETGRIPPGSGPVL